jgi:hypothetical protein
LSTLDQAIRDRDERVRRAAYNEIAEAIRLAARNIENDPRDIEPAIAAVCVKSLLTIADSIGSVHADA